MEKPEMILFDWKPSKEAYKKLDDYVVIRQRQNMDNLSEYNDGVKPKNPKIVFIHGLELNHMKDMLLDYKEKNIPIIYQTEFGLSQETAEDFLKFNGIKNYFIFKDYDSAFEKVIELARQIK